MSGQKYTKEALEEVVRVSNTFKEVAINLGVVNPDYAIYHLTKRIKKEGISTTHFNYQKNKYTKEELANVVKSCTSIAQVVKKLGRSPNGGNITHMSKCLKKFDVDTKHFTGQAHNKGNKKLRRSPEEILIIRGGSTKESSNALRRALFEIGRKEECVECGQGPEWNGKFLRLHIDHINGDNMDNRKENLRILCPHCHSQTETFGAKNIHKGV